MAPYSRMTINSCISSPPTLPPNHRLRFTEKFKGSDGPSSGLFKPCSLRTCMIQIRVKEMFSIRVKEYSFTPKIFNLTLCRGTTLCRGIISQADEMSRQNPSQSFISLKRIWQIPRKTKGKLLFVCRFFKTHFSRDMTKCHQYSYHGNQQCG